jgi:hypothetical protein
MGSDQIRIGNGKGLSINHIGTTRLFNSQIDLLDILHVPTFLRISSLFTSSLHTLISFLNFILIFS